MTTKKIKLTLTTALLLIAATTFAQEDKKTKKARENSDDAKKELHEARVDSAQDYKSFKEKADNQSAENQKKIAQLKEKNKTASKEIKEEYEKKIEAIENKNDKLKRLLTAANNTQTSKWVAFKREFNHDLDEMNNAIDDLTKNNVK